MKILVLCSARSKSTTLNRFLKLEYPSLSASRLIPDIEYENREKFIQESNSTSNVIYKLYDHELIDYRNKKIIDFTLFDFKHYDKIYVITRNNKFERALSTVGERLLHKKEGRSHYHKDDPIPTLVVNEFDMVRAIKSDLILTFLVGYVQKNNNNIKYFDYENFEQQFLDEFDKDIREINLNISPVNFDYKKITKNYNQAEKWFNRFNHILSKLTLSDIQDHNSIFWKL